MSLERGDKVLITFADRTVEGEVLLVDKYGKAGAVRFEAILGGYVGMMPVMTAEDGSQRDLCTGRPVEIRAGEADSEVTTHDYPHTCPYCGKGQECVTGPTRAAAREGDVVLCFECAGIGVMDSDGKMAKLEDEKLFRYMLSPMWREVEAAQAFIKSRRGLEN